MDFSNYLADALIDATVRKTTYTTPTQTYVALYTSDPTKNNTGTEVSGTTYTRFPLTMDAPDDGVTQNTNEMEWAVAMTVWGTITHVGIMDAEVAGNLLYFAELIEPKNITVGDQFQITPTKLKLTLT
tara:strand:+ start:2275 stop:2658 length:384 start_codon:yes stop_codon:yes gene_type:complete